MARRQSPKLAATVNLQPLTANRFTGGLDLTSSEETLDTSYARVLENISRGKTGGMEVSQGTELLADLAPGGAGVQVDGYYFYTYVITVDENGKVFAVDGTGVGSIIWSPEIAAISGLPPWGGDLLGVTFVEFNGDLVIHNGIDKPIIISPTLIVTYLQDLATGSNINVPIGRWATKHGRWHVVAVGSELYITHIDTSGTFFGDPAPNIGTILQLGPRVVSGNKAITGLLSFRDYLLVFFAECLIPMQIAVDESSGTPVLTADYSDAIEGYGALNQRVLASLGDEVLSTDIIGTNTLTRSIFSKVTDGGRVNSRVFPAVQKMLSRLSVESLRDRTFSIFDRIESTYMLFIPSADVDAVETVVFMYLRNKKENTAQWSVRRGWNWRWVTRTAQGNIIFGRGSKLFLLGRSDIRPVYSDYVGEQEPWSDGTVWADNTGWSPVVPSGDVPTSYQGVDILFDWQWPWSEMKHGGLKKINKFISFSTLGQALFTAEMFIDGFLYPTDDNGEEWSDGTLWSDGTGWSRYTLILDPAITLQVIANDRSGFGQDTFGTGPYGLGAASADQRPYNFPAQFQKMKLRISGRIREALTVNQVRLFHQVGSMRR